MIFNNRLIGYFQRSPTRVKLNDFMNELLGMLLIVK